MFRRNYNLVLMAVWLGIAAVVLFPERFFRPGARVPGGAMAGVLALTLAGYNLVRWWAYRSLRRNRPGPNPLAVRRRRDEGEGDAA
jgi:hypothetical protein